MIGAIRTWLDDRATLRRLRLAKLAWPTLTAMCRDPQAAAMWGRSVDRLWLDGGSIRGFRVLVKLGYAAWNVDREGERIYAAHEAIGHVTDAGRAAWKDHPYGRSPLCRCPVL